jgi:hypothetical protein
MKLIDQSIGFEIENLKVKSKIELEENSQQTVNQIVEIITGKYSRDIYEGDVHRQIGKLTKANMLLKVSIIPGGDLEIAPIIMANLLPIEKLTKFNYSGSISIDLDGCSRNIKSQFKLLYSKRNGYDSYSETDFKQKIARFLKSQLFQFHGKDIFIDKFRRTAKNDLAELNFNYWDYLFRLIHGAITDAHITRNHRVKTPIGLVKSHHKDRLDRIDHSYLKYKRNTKVLIVPEIVRVIKIDKGYRLNVSITVIKNPDVLIGQKIFIFDLDYHHDFITLRQFIPGDVNDYKARKEARLYIYEQVAERVASLLYTGSVVTGDELTGIKSKIFCVKAFSNERDDGKYLYLDIDLTKCINLNIFRR